MPYPHVTSLYRYRAIDDYTLEGLRNENIWVSQPDSFNDPFDCSTDNYAENIQPKTIDIIAGRGVPWIKEVDLDDRRNVKKLTKTAYDRFLKLVTSYGVISLTEDCESILMWSHYADSHRGICMEFERGDSCALGDYDTTRPISYSRHCPHLDPNKLFDESDVTSFGIELMNMMLVKSADWSYEREWRAVYRPGNCLKDYPGTLKSIIWGLRTSDEDKIAIKGSLKDSAVIFRQAKRVPREFRIVIVAEQI